MLKKIQQSTSLATLNTVSLLGDDNKVEIFNSIFQMKINISIICLQEVRMEGNGCIDIPNLSNPNEPFRLLYSGTNAKDKKGQAGVGIGFLDPNIKIINHKFINKRIMYADVSFSERSGTVNNIKISRIISIYAPTNCSYSIEEKLNFIISYK